MNEEYNLSFSSMAAAPARCGQHAIVVGAGMGGLAAAAALARHFEQVTVLERDQLASEASPPSRHTTILPPSWPSRRRQTGIERAFSRL
jgi:glycine/D-amino acid oxidase-like deaminating enzyme